jgi:hypothetical protein
MHVCVCVCGCSTWKTGGRCTVAASLGEARWCETSQRRSWLLTSPTPHRQTWIQLQCRRGTLLLPHPGHIHQLLIVVAVISCVGVIGRRCRSCQHGPPAATRLQTSRSSQGGAGRWESTAGSIPASAINCWPSRLGQISRASLRSTLCKTQRLGNAGFARDILYYVFGTATNAF